MNFKNKLVVILIIKYHIKNKTNMLNNNVFIRFKEQLSLEERKRKAEELLLTYPERIPIIIEKDKTLLEKEQSEEYKNGKKIPNTTKTKFLVNRTDTVDNIILVVKNQLQISSEQAIFLLVNSKYALSGNSLMSTVYEKYKDEDGFLYLTFALELIWGC